MNTSWIQRLKTEVLMSELLEYYGWGGLTYFGDDKWQTIHCPFHLDRDASAGFNDLLGRFNCFSCGISGDIFDLVMELEHLSLKEAGAFLYDKFELGEDEDGNE